MTNEQFDALVARLERQAEHHPAAYKLKLGAFATLGYVYIFSVLLILLTVTAALVVAIATFTAATGVRIPVGTPSNQQLTRSREFLGNI